MDKLLGADNEGENDRDAVSAPREAECEIDDEALLVGLLTVMVPLMVVDSVS